jgi:MiaB/RimO family radical SAM methylthiotransferase
MKVFIHGLNTCGMRNVKIWSYRDFLLTNGHEIVDNPADAEVAVLWTCAFRTDVRDNSLSEIARYLREYSAEVVVAGCLPDIDRNLMNKHFKGRVKIVNWSDDEEKMQEIFGAPNKRLSEIPLILSKEQLYEDEATFRKENPGTTVPYIGRYTQLYISEGCNWECTYCSERLAFPPYRSFPEEEIVQRCRWEVEQSGKKAVVLLGDSTGDYGSDTGSSLPTLIHRLLENVAGLRIAIQDLNPFHFLKFYKEMVDLLRARIILHLQIPYQSASDRILRLMKRPYSCDDLNTVFSTINEIGFTEIDSHMIVGFPSETEKDFEESLQFAIDYHPKYMLVNSFLESPGMPATKLPGKVDLETKRRRMMKAEERLKASGIINNCDYSQFARERFLSMNQPNQS